MHKVLELKNTKNRLLGIDYGERFIGLAISDFLWRVVRPFPVFDQRKQGNFFTFISNLILKETVAAIVLGYPKNMDGSEGFACDRVKAFAQTLEEMNVPIIFWDERMTTVLAENIMLENDLSRQKRKKKIDSLAATYILQSFLDHL